MGRVCVRNRENGNLDRTFVRKPEKGDNYVDQDVDGCIILKRTEMDWNDLAKIGTGRGLLWTRL
jgi:hypothetical protein